MAGLLQATSLPFIVTASQIGIAIGALDRATATAFVAGGRTLIGSAVGLDAAPERRLAVMGARAAAAQLGYFVGSAVAGGALTAGGYPGFGLALGVLFLVSALPFMVDARARAGTVGRALLGPACART